MIFVLLVAAGLLFWAGVHNLRARRAVMQERQQSQVTMTKDDGTGSGGGPATGRMRGKPAPGFTMKDVNGKTVALADFKGRPVIVNFWATWCGPCRLEMPWFAEFHTKYAASGVEILGISEDDSVSTAEIVKAAAKVGVNYPILLHDAAVTKAYGGVEYLPSTFYIDRNGVIAEETAGAPSKDEMEANVRRISAGGGH